MALVNVASTLPSSLLMTSEPPPGGDPALVYTIVGQRGLPLALTNHGVTYDVDQGVYDAYLAAHPERAEFLQIVTQADIDAMIAEERDPANYGFEVGLVPPVPPDPPANVDVPHVTLAGNVLSCTMGNWSGEPTSYAYQWQTNGANVGTNASSYTVQAADAGKTATCTVTATNANGSTAAPPSNGVVLPNPTAAVLTGGVIADPAILLSGLAAFSDAAFVITINGNVRNAGPTSLSSGSSSLALIAGLITGMLGGASVARCTWSDATSQFTITTTLTGAAATLSFASSPASGSDISDLCAFTQADGASIVNGTNG